MEVYENVPVGGGVAPGVRGKRGLCLKILGPGQDRGRDIWPREG